MTLFSSFGQFNLFLWSLSFGCIAGIIYEVCIFSRRLFKFKLYINIIFDTAFAVLIVFLFIVYFTHVCNFQLRFFIFLGIFLGFSLERISIGNYIAKICDMVYNVYCKIKVKYLEWLKKRQALKDEKKKAGKIFKKVK